MKHWFLVPRVLFYCFFFPYVAKSSPTEPLTSQAMQGVADLEGEVGGILFSVYKGPKEIRPYCVQSRKEQQFHNHTGTIQVSYPEV